MEKIKGKDKDNGVITFIAPGLLEFKMTLNVGGALLPICFSGGSMGSNGVLPARYTTDNQAIQKIIMESPQFKSKRIRRL